MVFTAGAGELDWKLREKVLDDMGALGIVLDKNRNEAAVSRERESLISNDGSPVKAFVIPTDEEIVFIEDVAAILEGRYETHTHFKYSFENANYMRKL